MDKQTAQRTDKLMAPPMAKLIIQQMDKQTIPPINKKTTQIIMNRRQFKKYNAPNLVSNSNIVNALYAQKCVKTSKREK